MSTFQFLLFRKNNALYWKILILCLTHVPNILITFQIPLFFQNKTYIAHGHDMISIRMIKLCGISIYKLLEIIFQNCLRLGKFPSEWKKANVAPTFKIGDKQCIKNHHPVSLLPVCGKVFESLLYNNMFSFFSKNNLILPKQSGFRPGDSCTNQLLFFSIWWWSRSKGYLSRYI